MNKYVFRKRSLIHQRRLCTKFRHKAFPTRTFIVNQTLFQEVEKLAVKEKQPVEQVAMDLVALAKSRYEKSRLYREGWQRLTPREQEVVGLVRQGYTNKQIATQLTISPDTVKTHVHNLLVKLDLHRKNEVMAAFNEKDFTSEEGQDK